MQIINAQGWECPKPIIHTKQLLDTIVEGTVCTIVDDQIALNNLLEFGQSLGYEVKTEEEGGLWRIYTTKTPARAALGKEAGDLVIVITSNELGHGNSELAEVLMRSYIFALKEVSPLPNSLIFINSGVFLTTKESPVEETLAELEAEGVDIISCGACLDFYGLKESLIAGRIGNMYMIAEKMNRAAKSILI